MIILNIEGKRVTVIKVDADRVGVSHGRGVADVVLPMLERIEELEAQLSAVGAGGVSSNEPLQYARTTTVGELSLRIDVDTDEARAEVESLEKRIATIDDFRTHRESWRAAIGHCVSASVAPADCDYWKHEAKAFDRAFALLDAAPEIPDTLQAIAEWFTKAFPVVTDHNRAVQFGCNLEEVAEGLDAIGLEADSDVHHLHELADDFKRKLPDYRLLHKLMDAYESEQRRADLLDSLGDQIVTAVGVAYMMGFDIIGALQAINTANYDKFVDGQPIYKPNGKLDKRPGWEAPSLAAFSKRKEAV